MPGRHAQRASHDALDPLGAARPDPLYLCVILNAGWYKCVDWPHFTAPVASWESDNDSKMNHEHCQVFRNEWQRLSTRKAGHGGEVQSHRELTI